MLSAFLFYNEIWREILYSVGLAAYVCTSNTEHSPALFNFSPKLTWRDMQHLTVLTSKRNSLFDAKNRFHWTMNGVGLEFNHLFGFGVLDAGAMVALAKQWKSVPARYHCEAGADKIVR